VKIKKRTKNKFFSYYLPFCIIALGAIVRLIYISSVPGGLHNDESYSAWNAFSLYTGGIDSAGYHFPIYFEAWGHGQSALYTYLILPLFALNRGTVTPFLIRLPQAAVAIASLWVVYLLLKKMFNPKIALWGLFLLAICPWHIMMSRWGLDANLAPGFLLFGLYFFILGLEKNSYFVLSAVFYGLSLYCYAVIWPIVPIILLLQILYGMYHKKIKINKTTIFSGIILVIMALPLMLFLLINMGYLPEISTKYFSIYKMSSLRDSEIAHSLKTLLTNMKDTLYFLYHQDGELPYDILKPYGLFYQIGMIFIYIGMLSFLWNLFNNLRKKIFSYEFFIFAQLVGAGILGCLIHVTLHKINCLYIPLVIIEAYGVYTFLEIINRFVPKLSEFVQWALIAMYILIFAGFMHSYFTDYKVLASTYYQEYTDEALDFAIDQGKNIGITEALKYPKVLIYTETTAQEYQNSLVYSDSIPTPKQFTTKGTTFYFGIDYTKLSKDMVYIIYNTEAGNFSDYQLTAFGYWDVAVPK